MCVFLGAHPGAQGHPGHRVSRSRGTGSVGDSVGEGHHLITRRSQASGDWQLLKQVGCMWIDMEREEQERTGATRSAAHSPAATLQEDQDATDADGQDATDAGQSVVERLALRAWSPRTPHLRHRLLTLCPAPRQF